MKEKKRGVNTRRILSWVAGLILVAGLTAAIVVTILYHGEIQDYVAGVGYEPTAEMVRMRDALGLTERARLIFNASQPEMNERGDFNRNCRSGEGDLAILGCYTGERIYIYNIANEELAGVREASLAHELLHAVWARMSERQREALADDLERVLAAHEELKAELEIYEEDERREELYVRAGTEVRDLPGELEAHYATVFGDQDAVVAYYEGYIAIFRGIEERLAEIEEEVTATNGELEAMVAEYERRFGQWQADVVSFNACAEVSGCFASEAAFRGRRAELVAEQEGLVAMYEEISAKVDEMNGLIDEYNANVVHGQMLNDAVNSLAVPEELE